MSGWDKVRRGLRCRGFCELKPQTIILSSFSVETQLYKDALASNVPQGVKGGQRIWFLSTSL